MKFSALSIPHFRLFMERSVGPMQKLVESLAADPGGSRPFAPSSTRWPRPTTSTT